PGKTRYEKMRHSRGACTRIGSRIKQGLSTTVAVVLNSQPIASNILGNLWGMIWLIRAQPTPEFESDSLDPLVLDLGKRLYIDIGRNASLLAEALQAIITFADCGIDYVEQRYTSNAK